MDGDPVSEIYRVIGDLGDEGLVRHVASFCAHRMGDIVIERRDVACWTHLPPTVGFGPYFSFQAAIPSGMVCVDERNKHTVGPYGDASIRPTPADPPVGKGRARTAAMFAGAAAMLHQ
jgi:hypothetical protein